MMPPWLLNLIPSAWIIYAIIASGALGLLAYSHHAGYVSGEGAYKTKIELAQKKHDVKVGNDYAKIDKSTPFNAERDVAGKWLLGFVRNGTGE